MPPTVPVPYIPRQRSTIKQTAAERAIQQKERADKAAEEDMAVEELRSYLHNAVSQLATQYNRSEQHFWSLLHFQVKDKTQKRRTSGFNAVVSELAQKENKDRPVGAKLSVKELTQKARAEGVYEQMPEAEVNRLVEKLNSVKASKMYGKRNLPHQKVGDASSTLKEVEASLLSLHERSGVCAMLFAVRSDTDFSMEPSIFFTDEGSRRFLSDVRQTDPQDFATRYEGWVLGGLKEITNSVQKHDANLKANIRLRINKGLQQVTGLSNASMVYSQNYDDKIVMRYGVHLEGWPLPKLTNPSNISGRVKLIMVSEALINGQCSWKQLTPAEFEAYKLRLEQEVKDGLRQPLKHGGSIGEKRVLPFLVSTRPKKRRRHDKGNTHGDDDDSGNGGGDGPGNDGSEGNNSDGDD